jgi:hypothetical protein
MSDTCDRRDYTALARLHTPARSHPNAYLRTANRDVYAKAAAASRDIYPNPQVYRHLYQHTQANTYPPVNPHAISNESNPNEHTETI